MFECLKRQVTILYWLRHLHKKNISFCAYVRRNRLVYFQFFSLRRLCCYRNKKWAIEKIKQWREGDITWNFLSFRAITLVQTFKWCRGHLNAPSWNKKLNIQVLLYTTGSTYICNMTRPIKYFPSRRVHHPLPNINVL